MNDKQNYTSRKFWLALLLIAALSCVAIPLLLTLRESAEEVAQPRSDKKNNNSKSPRIPASFKSLANEHFRVYYHQQLPAEEVAKVMQLLEKAQADFAQRFDDVARLEAMPRVEVIFYETTGDFTGTTGQSVWVSGVTTGALIELQPLLVLKQRGLLEAVLRHEYAHAVIESLKTASVARWISEGLALQFSGEGAMLKANPKLLELPTVEL